MSRDPRAFTLIELLVVVTIIVVLIALLTPALDKAIYQAELAACAANLDATAASVVLYTFDFKRHYPTRGATGGNYSPTGLRTHVIKLKDPILGSDDRTQLKGYVTMNKMFMDPLGPGDVDLENSHDDTHVYSTYSLYFGWSYGSRPNGITEAGMYKLGDRFSWTDTYSTGNVRRRFSVLISDFDRIDGTSFNSHPDRDGSLQQPNVLQDKAAFGIGTSGVLKQTLSYWTNPPGRRVRGLIDMNTAFGDGSVSRYSDVRWNEYQYDSPLTSVPEYAEGANYVPPDGNYNHIPER